mgnify:CR=1 FL=1
MQKAKLSIFTFILLLTFISNLFAQEDNSQIDLTNKYALQFGISSNFTLSSFQGSTISAKYHFNNNSALRLGVTLSQSEIDQKFTATNEYPDTLYNSFDNDYSSSQQIYISLHYIRYLKTYNSIAMYYGGGINYFTAPRNIESSSSNQSREASTINYTNFGVGISALIGVEWFVRSNMGITAEYGLGYEYSIYEKEEIYYDNLHDNIFRYKTDRTNHNFTPSVVRFGLSVYF